MTSHRAGRIFCPAGVPNQSNARLGVAAGMEKTLKNDDNAEVEAEVDDGSVAEWKHEPLQRDEKQ